MSCYFHEGREAVSKCARCGVDLCRECEEAAIYRTENGRGQALCLRCSYNAAQELVEYQEKWLKRTKLLLIFGGCAVALGIFQIISNEHIIDGLFAMLICFFIASLIFSFFGNQSEPSSVRDQFYDAQMSVKHPISYGFGKIIGMAFSAPLVLGGYFIGYKNTLKSLEEDRELLKVAEDSLKNK